MLKKLAVALVAASVFAAPVLAATGPTGTHTSAISKTVAPVKSVKHVKRIRHTGKQVRNFRHGKVAHSGKGRTAIKSTGHVVKGPRLAAAHKGSNTSAVR